MRHRLDGLRRFLCRLWRRGALGALQLQLEIADRRLGFAEPVLEAADVPACEEPNQKRRDDQYVQHMPEALVASQLWRSPH